MAKRWLAVALAAFLGIGLSWGADQPDFPLIYIDADAGDGGVGSQADPYNDLADVNWTTGGDNSIFDYLAGSPSEDVQVLCQTDDIWREQFTIDASGNATYRIILGKYGSGADPIISGMRDLTGWDTGGNWTEDAATESQTLGTMDADFNPTTPDAWFRNEVLANTTTNDGTEIRVKLEAHSTANTVVTGCSVGEQHAVNGEDYAAAPTRITFDTGNNGVTITAGTEKWSDWMVYTWTTANDHLIHVNIDALAGDVNVRRKENNEVSWRDLNDGDRTMTEDVNSDDPEVHVYAVEEIEIKTGGAGNVWILNLASDPKRVVIDGTEYTEAETKGDIDATHRWFYDSGNTDLYVYATENPATAYSSIYYSNTGVHGMFMDAKSYITIQDLTVEGGAYSITIYNASSNILIHDCTIGQYAVYTGVRVRGLVASPYTQVSDVEIYDNTFNGGYSNAADDYDNTVGMDGVHFYNGVTTSKVYRNTFTDFTHTGVQLESDTANHVCDANEIYDNVFSAPNTNYFRGINFRDDGNSGTVTSNKAYRNHIYDVTVRSQMNADSNEFYYNIIHDVTQGLDSTGVPDGIGVFGPSGASCHDNLVYNNVIYNVEGSGIAMAGEPGFGDCVDNLVRNNLIMNWGTGEYGIKIDNHATMLDNTYQNNSLYKSGVTDVVDYRGVDRTIAEFNAENGNNSDVMGDNIGGDPLMTNPASDDFTLQSISPCIDAGVDVGLTRDFAGSRVNISKIILPVIMEVYMKARLAPVIDVPNIGAYEYRY